MTNPDPYADAQEAMNLRAHLHYAAADAVNHGVNRDWVNERLNRLGAPLITGKSEYRIWRPITGSYGATVTASSRAEALEKFNAKVEKVKAAGRINDCHSYGNNVYDIQFSDAEPTFYSGPQDIEQTDVPTLALVELKAAIRAMLKDAVAGQGWGLSYAQRTLDQLGIEPLPALTSRTVMVPVSGMAEVNVPVFEGDDEGVVQLAVSDLLARSGSVVVKPEEIGMLIQQRSFGDPDGDTGFHLIDDDE